MCYPLSFTINFTLHRRIYSDTSTIGDLVLDGKFLCNTLEDVARPLGIKVAKKTAIQPNIYIVRNTMSKRFGKIMPEILNVPFFSGVRIHPGNDADDTEGCILPGIYNPDIPNFVSKSRVCYEMIARVIAEFEYSNTILIDIRNNYNV